MKRVSPGVYFSARTLVCVKREDMSRLKQIGLNMGNGRSRLCTHPNIKNRLHEMLIVHGKGVYVRPHRHQNKPESYHVIEGSADLLFFDIRGRLTEVIPLGDMKSGRTFYCRINDSRFHMLVIRSEVFVFHEATTGPFQRRNAVFPPWAPDLEDKNAQRHFMKNLEKGVKRFHALTNGGRANRMAKKG